MTMVPAPLRTATSAPMPFAQKPSIMRACSVGGRDAKILVLAQESAWNRPDLYLVTLDVDAGLDQKALESEVDQRGGADVQSLNGTDVTLLRVEIGAQDQKPVHVLRERSEELAAFPTR